MSQNGHPAKKKQLSPILQYVGMCLGMAIAVAFGVLTLIVMWGLIVHAFRWAS